MAVKKGLGKGLDTIIPSNKNLNSKSNDMENVSMDTMVTLISINRIEPNKKQPRKSFNEDALHELAESIKQHGVFQPLIVTKEEDYYKIVAGERRWRAARIAGLKEIPVIIKEYSPKETIEIALIENIQRVDLNPIEEAKAYLSLIDEFNLKQDEVAERVSKSRTAVTNSLRLLKLDERVQQMLIEEFITSGHARALLALNDMDMQYEIASQIFDEKLSVRETEKLMKKLTTSKKEKKEKDLLENEFVYKDLEEKLKVLIGTKVMIKRKDLNNGKIEIDYYTKEELDRIVNILLTIQE